MAEQTGHNVVNQIESTSGSPLVDVAANQINAHSADSGLPQSGNPITFTAALDTPETIYDVATSANAATHELTESGVARDVADPSAGDATETATHDAFAPSLLEKPLSAHGEIAISAHEDGSIGDNLPDDGSNAGLSADLSVNSDTDNSRADGGEQRDGNHHVRTNSVKRPLGFSKVTATKSFMSKIAPTAPTVTKTGEKPSPISSPAQLTNKPRLIAKIGSSQSVLKARVGTASVTGPDASKVWNKNQPVAPPPPRHFTDEELKQQYGIHLATRLQSDENGKDSKWADIEDDEDDWAPEAVVWMDGTKSTVAQDVTPEPEKKEQQPIVQQSKPTDGTKPTLSVKRSDRPEQVMRILKPGAAATQLKSGGPSASPSPGPGPKALTAKSPAGAPPAKSPWAPVPKPDTVSPINPPVQPPPPRQILPSQDARAGEPMQPPPVREIAADTFDRSFREGDSGTRELFNSTNGRYEPAPEGRRGSMRQDGYRKPAVLQRPSQAVSSPAEPSAAFQSRSSSQMDGSWGRRRGSSVSQGSLPPARRMSVNQRPELSVTPEVPLANAQSATIDGARPSFAQKSAWEQQMPPRPEEAAQEAHIETASPAEDPIKVQERVMREKRELAKKRRQDQEAADEAAKQDRLKAKLAALEGAGKSKKEREAEAAAAAVHVKESSSAEPLPTSPHGQANVVQPVPVSTAADSPLISQNLPQAAEQSQQALSTAELPAPLPPKLQHSNVPNRPAEQQPKQAPIGTRPSAPYQAPVSSYSSPGDRKQQPFGRSPVASGESKFSPWPTTAPHSNVWGSSGIGNGTFDGNTAFAPLSMSQQNSSLPPPPGMARGSNSARISPQNFGNDTRTANSSHLTDQQRGFAPSTMDSRPEHFSNRLGGTSPAHDMGRQQHHPPGPIGPPSRTQQQAASHAERDPIRVWHASASRVPQQYASDIQAAEERRRQETAIPDQPVDHRFKETFKKTSTDQGRLGAPRKYEATEVTVHDHSGSRSVPVLSPAPPATQTQQPAPELSMSPAQGSWVRPPLGGTVKIPDGSQNPAHGGVPKQPPIGTQPASAVLSGSLKFTAAPVAPITESKDQSQPPPEIERHPAFEGDPRHPNVRLPPPQAKVRLPPTSPSGSPTQVSSQQHGLGVNPPRPYPGYVHPGMARPIVNDAAWQARFNGLFNRTAIQTETPPSPPKTPPKMQSLALAVAASSRAPMDAQAGGAKVSLPTVKKTATNEGFVLDNGCSCHSKPIFDIYFFEELRFGSVPRVHIPRNSEYISTGSGISRSRYANSRIQKPYDVQSHPHQKELQFWDNPEGIFVNIQGTKLRQFCRRAGQSPKQYNDSRKPSHIQGNRPGRGEDRRPSGRINKNRNGKDAAHEATAGPSLSKASSAGPSSRKPSVQKVDNSVKMDRTSTPVHSGDKSATPRGQRNVGTTNATVASSNAYAALAGVRG